ncbi:MAG: HepT-like ribonuclease domain-containing protein [Hyphomonadaceae bacterium]
MDDVTRSLLNDMREYASDAIEFLGSKEAADLEDDKIRRFALIRAIEVIGEAATKVEVTQREAMPELQWGQMIGMRNILIHGYTEIRITTLVATVQENLPELVTLLDKILGDT